MTTTLIIIGSIFAIIIIFRIVMFRKMKKTPLVSNHKDILVLTEQNFKKETKNRIVLVDFWADWCAPCRMIAPILNDVSAELPKGTFVGKVDIQKHQSLATKFKVRNIPTLLILKNGKEVKRIVGIKNKNYFLDEISKIQ